MAPPWDRAARLAWASRLRASRSSLADLGRTLALARRFEEGLRLEAALLRLGRLIDGLEAGGGSLGRWVRDADKAPPGMLAHLDRALDEAVDELARTARSLSGEPSPRRLTGLDGLLRDLELAWSARQAALAVDEAPDPPIEGLAGLPPGSRVVVEGRPYEVTSRTRWRRGDASLRLAGAGAALELWQDPEQGLVLFERQADPGLAPDLPRLSLEGVDFALRWRDDGGGATSDTAGRAWRAGPRWLYASAEGVLLWLERTADALDWNRGLPLAEGDFRRV